MTIGERIRQARRAQGWTQVELSRRSGICAVHICRIETGKLRRGPHLRALTDLAKALGLDMREFYGGAG